MEAPQLDPKRLRLAMVDWSRACGKRLRERRLELKISQEQLAGLVGVRSTAISKFELGIATPKDSVRHALAFALSIEVATIWPPLDRDYMWAVARPVAAA